jgi:hypothetical protein
LKEAALDRTMWRARFGRGFGPVVKQTTKWMNLLCLFYVFRCATHLYQGEFTCPLLIHLLLRSFYLWQQLFLSGFSLMKVCGTPKHVGGT